MIELDKIPCQHQGCDCHAARALTDGSSSLDVELLDPVHHGRLHNVKRIDLRRVLAKVRRSHPELFSRLVSKK